MQTLWNQEEPLDPTFDRINRCLREDWFLLPYELRLQRAHAAALRVAEVLDGAELEAVTTALDAIERDFFGKACPDSTAEDIHTWIEASLVQHAGDAGRKIHTARSRNDQVATLLKLFVIDAGNGLAAGLHRLATIACEQAERWAELVFPLQTHNQFAAPGSVGFWALRYAAALVPIAEHVRSRARAWRQQCPLGAAAVAGSAIPIDRHLQAKGLGFVEPAPNALAVTSTRDECVEYLALAAQVALHLQSFATDVIVFTQTPLGWTIYPGSFATGSSMMPNKRNPDAMELLRGECSSVLAAHGHALTLLKGLPSGYNRDLQCIKPIVHQASEKMSTLCAMTATFFSHLDFDRQKTAASLEHGGIAATLRMEQEVQQGRPLRDAHHAVARRVRDEGPQALRATSQDAALYMTSGSASPEEVRRIAAGLRNSLERLAPPGSSAGTPRQQP